MRTKVWTEWRIENRCANDFLRFIQDKRFSHMFEDAQRGKEVIFLLYLEPEEIQECCEEIEKLEGEPGEYG